MGIHSRTIFTALCDDCGKDVTGEREQFTSEEHLRRTLKRDGLIVRDNPNALNAKDRIQCEPCQETESVTLPTENGEGEAVNVQTVNLTAKKGGPLTRPQKVVEAKQKGREVMTTDNKPAPLLHWWVSWWEKPSDKDDTRPVTVPPKEEVPGYWFTGQRMDGCQTVVAVVVAATEPEAKAIVQKYWSAQPIREWRICNEYPLGWMPDARRFPPGGIY